MGIFCFVFGLSQAQHITKAEYFFDSDPGVGMASQVSIANPLDSVDVNFTIPLSFPGNGYHKLTVRTRNANGTWSLNETRTIYVLDNVAIVLPGNVLSYEYFLDSDPGLGKGTKGSIADTANINFTIPLSGLTPGFHIAGIRLFDSNKLWSQNETRVFYILPEVPVVPATTVVTAEYFIDNDPGVGNGTKMPDFASGDSVVVNISPSIAGLNPGFHTLLVRAKNSAGVWGLQDSRVFYIDSALQFKSGPIVEAEYYIDSDPGLSMATQITPLIPGDSINEYFSVDASLLAVGAHNIVVRVKDSIGTWSLAETKTFTIKDSTGTSVITSNENADKLVLYPNPAFDIMNVRFNLKETSNTYIEIFDFTGRKVQELLTENMSVGKNQIPINVSQLKSGIYLLQLKTTKGYESIHFMKQ